MKKPGQRLKTKDPKNKKLIFVISGPSGSGKTTLLKHLFKTKELKNKLVKSISFTTRPKRRGERNGRDYFFISCQEFIRRRKAKKFLEWTKYLDYYYATGKDFIKEQLRRNKNIVLCLDIRGAASLRRLYPKNTVTIFINSPSLKELRVRIEKRCRETQKEEIRRRISIARQELASAGKYKYVLMNKELKQVIQKLKSVILKEIDNVKAR